HTAPRNAAHHTAGDIALSEASARQARRAAGCTVWSMAIAGGTRFSEDLLAAFDSRLCSANKRGREENRQRPHFDPSGSANTTSVEPSRQSWSGNSACTAPPTTDVCQPVDVATYWRPFTE